MVKHLAIAVCMATYEPDPALLRQQVDSIREQLDCEWHCFISDDHSGPEALRAIEDTIADDERFTLSRSHVNLGFYRNFERTIGMVPDEYELFALCDQDDRWHPDKLSTLRDGIGEARLIFSDQRVVHEDGSLIEGTYWGTRQNNFENLASLLVANTVTGAASLFRRSVVEKALPFPELPSEQYHDHWLAMVALSLGTIEYVDRPLYDYVQHENAVLGHEGANAGLMSAGWRRIDPRRWRDILGGWASAYFDVFLRLKAIAQTVLERCSDEMPQRKRKVLERFVGSDRSLTGFIWLSLRPLRRFAGHRETMGMERVLARGILYRHLAGARRRLPKSLGERLSRAAAPEGEPEDAARMRQKVSPLFPVVSKTQPERINLLIPTIDLDHLFGGYIAKFNLARRLAEAGRDVRIVTVDPTPPLPRDWREQVESYSQLDGLFDQVGISFARDGREPLRISPADRFIATTWWTAHVAARLCAQTGGKDFLYMIQEYEPLTVPEGAWRSLAADSYELPHSALFSTGILRDYFQGEQIGVFRGGGPDSAEALVFRNAITPVERPNAEGLRGREQRSLIFYGRPEAHAARNLYETGVSAIRLAVNEGVFAEDWRFFGIGSTGAARQVDLGGGRSLELLPRTGQEEYGRLLAGHDVGLALMDAPHPSLVPIEMASAGTVCVTSTYGNSKTAPKLEALSGNLVAAEPTVEGVAGALQRAVERSGDLELRVEQSAVDWPDDWDTAFDEKLVSSIIERLDPR